MARQKSKIVNKTHPNQSIREENCNRIKEKRRQAKRRQDKTREQSTRQGTTRQDKAIIRD
jgi:hypothetical protein